MSIFSDIAENMAVVNNQIFGDPAVFRPVGGDPVSCMVYVEYDVELQPDGYDAAVMERGVTIEAMVSEVGNPKRGDVFDVGGALFTVRKITENDGVFVTAVVHAN